MNKKIKRKFLNNDLTKNAAIISSTFRRTRLSSGIVVVTEEVPFVESFSMGVFVNGGSRLDKPDYSGTSHFIEHLIFRSSSIGTSKKIFSLFDEIGAYVNAYTTKEYTCYHIRALKNHFRKAAGLLCNILIQCEFRNKEFDKEKKIILEEIKLYQDDPDEMIFDAGEKLMYGNHPLGNPITGTKETLENITLKDLDKYYSDYYIPENLTISLTGNISHDIAIDFFENLFSGLPAGKIQNHQIKAKQSTGKELLLKNQVEQAYILLSCPGPTFISDDKFPLLVLDLLFCSGMSSRLQTKLRDKKGIVYYLDSEPIFYTDNGSYYITLVVDKSNISTAIDLIKDETIELQRNNYYYSELIRAKEQLKSSLIIEYENMSSRMRSLYTDEYYYGRHHCVRDILNLIDNVTKEQISHIINDYFSPESWNKVIMEPK